MQKRHLNRKLYFDELANTSREYYINYIESYFPLNNQVHVLEIGCGEGGNLLPFAEKGCLVTGIDCSPTRINQAKEFFLQSGYSGNFVEIDFFDMPMEHQTSKYDLILIHDVIEHIKEKDRFIKHLQPFVTAQSIIFWGFPAWQMPFGGHQQICRNKFCSSIPFIHLLPKTIYHYWLKIAREEDNCIHELMDIKECRTTIECFERLIKENNHKIIDRKLWFINPHYKEKFGLQPKRLYSFLEQMKLIRNFFSTSCFYLTTINNNEV